MYIYQKKHSTCVSCPSGKSSNSRASTCETCDFLYKLSSHCDFPILGIVLGISIALLVAILYVLFQRYRKKHMRVERNLRYDLHRTKQLCKAKQTDIRLLTNAWKLNSSQIKIHTKLASGAYGEVWKGSLRDRWIVAVKKMHESHKRVGRRHSSLAKSSSSAGRVFKDDEVRFLMRTRHERLVMFLGCGVDENGVSFVAMECMDGGSLDRALWRSSSNFANMSWLQRIQILLDVVGGLAYLHLMHKSIHQDLKSPNVLLEIDRHSVDHHDSSEQGGGETSSFRAKLGDF